MAEQSRLSVRIRLKFQGNEKCSRHFKIVNVISPGRLFKTTVHMSYIIFIKKRETSLSLSQKPPIHLHATSKFFIFKKLLTVVSQLGSTKITEQIRLLELVSSKKESSFKNLEPGQEIHICLVLGWRHNLLSRKILGAEKRISTF